MNQVVNKKIKRQFCTKTWESLAVRAVGGVRKQKQRNKNRLDCYFGIFKIDLNKIKNTNPVQNSFYSFREWHGRFTTIQKQW